MHFFSYKAHIRLIVALLCLSCAITASAHVVISEVHWAGTSLSTADEWLELSLIPCTDGFVLRDEVDEIENGELKIENSQTGSGEFIHSSGANALQSGTGSSIFNSLSSIALASDDQFSIFNSNPPCSSEIDLTNWSITSFNSNGEERTIVAFGTGVTISSGQYLVVANYSADDSRLEIEPDIVTTSISLPNTKLLLRLRDASGSIIDQVDDGIGAPFAGFNASGSGWRASMERIDLSGSGTLKENWQSAQVSIGFDSGALVLGTPGLGLGNRVRIRGESGEHDDEFLILEPNPNPQITITEILPNPIGRDDHEWIEIANTSTGTLDISGWTLRDSSKQYAFPGPHVLSGVLISSGTILEPDQHLLIDKSVSGLSLSNKGEAVSIFSGEVLVDTLEYPELPEGISYTKTASGAQATCIPTPRVAHTDQILDPQISIQNDVLASQSGTVSGTGKLTLNLQAIVQTGSIASATCQWNYGDGYESASCNPPSHTFREPGTYTISLEMESFCGDQIQRQLTAHVHLAQADVQRGSSITPKKEPCTPLSFGGVMISEFLPDPYGEEKIGEWIELLNTSDTGVNLCGWTIDDDHKGSKPYKLDDERIAPGEYLLLPREQTGIALNNSADRVRLFGPGSGVLLHDIAYAKSIEGESFALRDDQHFVWTPFASPGASNRFRTAERRFPTDRIVVSAALPNPAGKDDDAEWIEISNVSDETIDLAKWSLDNKPGGSQPFELSGSIEPIQTIRYPIRQTGITLVNSKDVVRLLDPDGYTTSTFGWTEAVEGRIYRRPVITSERAKARVINVVDGDTIDIQLTDVDQLNRLPPSLKRRWIGVGESDNPKIRVRMIGIDTPESVHPSKAVEQFGLEASQFTKELLFGTDIELAFDREIWDKYDRLLAYVYDQNGEMVQAQLLRSGLAYAYLRFPFLQSDAFRAYEQEARSAQLGLWSSAEATDEILSISDQLDEQIKLLEDGLTLSANYPSGLVTSGTTITFTPSVRSDVYVSINSGAFQVMTGAYVVTDDVHLHAYAERKIGTGSLRSDMLERYYILERESYALDVIISEIYPSPHSGEEEWIELRNLTGSDASLAGWLLDDERDEGSTPWVFPPDLIIPGSGYLLLSGDQTGTSFNNDGDGVWLIPPDESIVHGLTYSKVKRGKSVVSNSVETDRRSVSTDEQNGFFDICITDVPTPNASNMCYQFVSEKDAVDADHDFLRDDYEQILYSTNTHSPDTDGDGWIDGFEVQHDLDPQFYDEPNRELQKLYTNFVQNEIDPEWKLYKRKGLVIRVDAYPHHNISVQISDEDIELIEREKDDGSLEYIIQSPLAAGIHSVDILVEDIVGREVVIRDAVVIELEEEYLGLKKVRSEKLEVRSAIAQLKLSPWDFGKRYENVFPWMEEQVSEQEPIPEVLANLLERQITAVDHEHSGGTSSTIWIFTILSFLGIGQQFYSILRKYYER